MSGVTSARYLHHVATALPPQWLTLEQSEKLLQQGCPNRRSEKLLQRIGRLAGVEKRHLAALDFMQDGEPMYRPSAAQPAGPGMSERSAAFDRAADRLIPHLLDKLPADMLAGIATLVTVSCTHASSPGLERPIFLHGRVPPSAQRWNLGFMGCSAGLAALRLVCEADCRDRASLIVACELSSLHFQYTDELDQMTANVLFADGAAAVLMAPSPSPIEITACRCLSIPESADQMVWFAGDHGLQLRLSQELPQTLSAHLPRAMEEFLSMNGLTVPAVDHWIVHPGGPQILDGVTDCLGLRPDALWASRLILRRYGNMSSPTVFFVLKELLDSGATGSAVAVAFGPGLTVEMALLQLGTR